MRCGCIFKSIPLRGVVDDKTKTVYVRAYCRKHQADGYIAYLSITYRFPDIHGQTRLTGKKNGKSWEK